MNKLTRLAFLGLAFMTMLGLSACEPPSASAPAQTVNPTVPAEEHYDNYNISQHLYVGVKKLPDGRTVTCVAYADYNRGGLTCDFANAK